MGRASAGAPDRTARGVRPAGGGGDDRAREQTGYFVPELTVDGFCRDRQASPRPRVPCDRGGLCRCVSRTWPRWSRPAKSFARLLEGGYSLGAIEADRRFHEALIEAARMRRLSNLYQRAPLPLIHGDTEDPDRWREACVRTLAEHRQILAALAARDVDEAKRVLRAHLAHWRFFQFATEEPEPCDRCDTTRTPCLPQHIQVLMSFDTPRPSAILLLASAALSTAAEAGRQRPIEAKPNTPEMIRSDGKLRLSFGEERVVLPRGLQPSLLCTRSGTLVLQAQVPGEAVPVESDGLSLRDVYPRLPRRRAELDHDPAQAGRQRLEHGGRHHPVARRHDHRAGHLRHPRLQRPATGVGQLYISTDDWKTLAGPARFRSTCRTRSSTGRAMTAGVRTRPSGPTGESSSCPTAICSRRSTAGSRATPRHPRTRRR